jgi:hypothetical protein
MPACMLACVAY